MFRFNRTLRNQTLVLYSSIVKSAKQTDDPSHDARSLGRKADEIFSTYRIVAQTTKSISTIRTCVRRDQARIKTLFIYISVY